MTLMALFALTLTSAGCIVNTSGGGGGGGGGGSTRTTGDLTLLYTFGGATCQAAGASRVVVRIEGVDVGDGSTKDVLCRDFPEGMTVRDLLAGTYAVRVEGYDDQGLLYQMDAPEQVSVVRGAERRYEIDVPATFGDLTIYWSAFGNVSDCGAAGIDQVVASLFDASDQLVDSQTLACSDGGVTWSFIAPGSYTVQLDAYDATGLLFYQGVQAITVSRGQADTYDVALSPVTGSLTVFWTFRGSAVCGGVQKVRVVVENADGVVYDDAYYACSMGGITYDAVPAEPWRLTLQGVDASNVLLFEGSASNVVVDVGQNTSVTVDLQ
jgi:hypothetical protein